MGCPMRVRVFLRSSFFTLPGEEAHVPTAAVVLDGSVEEQNSGWVRLTTSSYMDERGRKLNGSTRTLLIPVSKIDHMLVVD